MLEYKIIFKDNRGSFAIDAIAHTVQGDWHNIVNNFDGKGHDIGFVDVPSQYAAYMEEILTVDENVIKWNRERRIGK